MALKEAIELMVNYNDQLNRRIWDSIRQLREEDFTATITYSHGSLRDQIVHMAGVDGRWTRGLKGLPDARAFQPAPDDFPTRDSAFALWEPVAREFKNQACAFDEAGLLRNPPGMEEPAWQVILHVVNHGTDHRAQILRAVHDLGGPTFDQDLIMYVWGLPK